MLKCYRSFVTKINMIFKSVYYNKKPIIVTMSISEQNEQTSKENYIKMFAFIFH